MSVTELCEGGTLESALQYMGAFSESLACHVIEQVLEGLDYMHNRHIIHRNLSLRHILFKKK